MSQVSLNIFYPVTKGPRDNGDFTRIFAAFSSGPVGLPFWPTVDDPSYYQRFFHFYHRYWRFDGAVQGADRPSTSALVSLPGRLLRLGSPSRFDLAANAFYLTIVLSAALFTALVSLRDATPFVALAAFSLLASDANVSGYLNSFYQESGAFVFFLLYLFGLYAFWQRRQISTFLLATGFCILLGGTKVAYTPAAFFLLIPLFIGLGGRSFASKSDRIILAGTAVSAFVAICVALWMLPDPDVTKPAAYHFVFTAALPVLPPGEQSLYLQSLGLDPSYVTDVGKGAWDYGSHFANPDLNQLLGLQLHARAVGRLAIDHPLSILRLVAQALSLSGTYPQLTYGDVATGEGPIAAVWAVWSTIHNTILNGWLLYGAALACSGLVVSRALRHPSNDWLLFFALTSACFCSASILEAVVSMFGNGVADIFKHNFLATLLADSALTSGLAGIYASRQEPTAIAED